jgi:signal transduction histidine kinase
MTLRLRFILLFIVLCAGLGVGLMVLTAYERHESATMLSDVSRQREDLLGRLLKLAGNSLDQFSRDYSLWSEAVDFVQQAEPDQAWAAVNFDASLASFNAQALWVLKPDGRLFYRVGAAAPARMPDLPPPAELLNLFRETAFPHFFLDGPGGLYEVRAAPIVPSDDIARATPPQGYLLVARQWNEEHLRSLAALTESEVTLETALHAHDPRGHHTDFHLHVPLPDWRGVILRHASFHYQSPELARLIATDRWEALIFFVYGVLAILAVMFFAQRWVLRPLTHVSTSLTTGSLIPLDPLLSEESELGRVARLVRTSFANREELRAALEDRSRLGRDLHDGVIQTLYASGMSLTSIRAILRKDPAAAEDLIDRTHGELNATIREVRNFITGLEPEPELARSFAGAVRTLLDFMSAGQPLTTEVRLDEALAERLPVAYRAELLQILREAVSNALRHGRCTRLEVTLQKRDHGFDFAIIDNGTGFDPDACHDRGRGLDNFARRAAALKAALDIKSQPGHGACILFHFPFPEPT